MYPSFEPDFNPPLAGQGQDIDPGRAETVDNGPNVLDGFTLTIDDFKPGDAIAYEWNLTNGGNPIDNNAFGFGVLSLTRSFEGFSGASEGFSTFPDPLFPFNTGFRQSQLEFFDTVYQVSDTTQFAVEMAHDQSVTVR